MHTIFNMMSVLYSFAIKPFLLLINFNTKILNQLIFTVLLPHIHVNYEKIIIVVQILNYYVYRTMYLFSVIPVVNTIRVLILYRNITNICHKLIIYSDWSLDSSHKHYFRNIYGTARYYQLCSV